MMDVSRPDGDGFQGSDESDDAAGEHLGTLRYLVGFLATLLVYGLVPPVVTGGAIWAAHEHLGIDSSLTLLTVGAVVGLAIYSGALIADRGASALTDPSSDGESHVSSRHRI